MIEPMHMPTEFKQVVETDSRFPIPVLKDDLQFVLRYLKGAMRQRIPDVLSDGIFSLLGASNSEDVAEWPER